MPRWIKNRTRTQTPRKWKCSWGGAGNASDEQIANRDALGPHLLNCPPSKIPAYVTTAAFPDVSKHMCPTTARHAGWSYGDHVEYYTDINGDWIVLTSPYLPDGIEIPNWAVLPRMYSELAVTYGCRIPKRGRRGALPKVAIAWNPFAYGSSSSSSCAAAAADPTGAASTCPSSPGSVPPPA